MIFLGPRVGIFEIYVYLFKKEIGNKENLHSLIDFKNDFFLFKPTLKRFWRERKFFKKSKNYNFFYFRSGKTFRIFILLPLLPAFEGDIASQESGNALRIILHYNYASICRYGFK